ncbi:hypothetical protein [Streptomyces hainanensis]|uniref:Integral membrane protein n=1 Tax=Streptomyces hainanensis TaxID=402648 RepID=A0A4R4TGP3_9ACTN|nr:hypothetical protein [Streptomyces hainanensis]TDC76680.1 hypothetical protein E1283_09170 [Streptomyces hainanensis]
MAVQTVTFRHASRAAARPTRRPLAAVAVGFAVLSLLLVPPTLALGWDEIVYVSRWPEFGPAAPFSAPRSRGVPLLVAPVAAVTDSVVALRCYLAAAAGLALYLGYRPWAALLPGRAVAPTAAAAYGALWFALFYGGAAMPNHYVAMAAVGAVGACVRGRWLPLALAVTAAGLMRASDAVWLALPLLAWPGRAGLAPRVAAVGGGLLAGVGPWLVEAELGFGGVWARLREASEIQGGTGLTFSLLEHAAALDGPLLCRPCEGDHVSWPMLGWWLLLPPLTAAGLYATRRTPPEARTAARPEVRTAVRPEVRTAVRLAVVTACSLGFTYLFLIDYAATRFLLPCYALLAVPVVLGLGFVAARLSSRAAAVGLTALALAQLAVQFDTLRTHARIQERARADWERVAEALRAHDVGPPCVLGGGQAIPVAHTLGCRAAEPGEEPTAFVLRDASSPRRARDWTVVEVADTYNPGWRVAVPPAR